MGSDQSKAGISEEEIHDFTNNTSMSGDEIREWYTKFFKECPSGLMSKAEFLTMYSKMFPDGDCLKAADHIFKAYDLDGNGTIDFKEFLCTVSVATRGAIDDKLRWAFHLYDLDGNGFVTKTECQEIVKAIYKMRGMSAKSTESNLSPKETTDEIFRQLDSNNDNKLSESEFVLGAKNSPSIQHLLQSVTVTTSKTP